MTTNTRKVLTLSGKSRTEVPEDTNIDIGVFDLLLPCRSFTIAHKVAELGRVSLTTEFLLRLLHSIDGMTEEDVGTFFDFNAREMSFLLNEAETFGYVLRRDGRIWMTDAGRGLFSVGSDEPQIFQVEERMERVGFDLISFALEDRAPLDRFAFELPELSIDPDVVALSSRRIPDSFRRHFTEIAVRRDSSAPTRKALYSIDNVVPDERFSAVLPVTLRSTAGRSAVVEPDLGAWRPAHELEDRATVVTAVANFIERLKVAKRSSDEDSYQVLLNLAPDFLKDFGRRDGLTVERYFREGMVRAGGFRSDRSTIPLVGPLFTQSNNRRLFEALGHAMQSAPPEIWPDTFYWRIPQQPGWGMTRVLPATLKSIALKLGGRGPVESAPMQGVAITNGKPPRYIDVAFGSCIESDQVSAFPASLEMLCVPRMVIAILVHSPVLSTTGFAVPLGLLSFDPAVVSRAQHIFVNAYPSCRRDQNRMKSEGPQRSCLSLFP